MDSFKTLVLVVLVCFAAGSANAQTDTTFFNNAVYVRLNIHELDSVIKSVQTQIQTLENLLLLLEEQQILLHCGQR